MKKAFLFCTVLGLVVLAKAQVSSEAIGVFESQNGERVYIIIDGVVQNNEPESYVEIYLSPGDHDIRLIFENPRNGQVLQRVYFNPWRRAYYSIAYVNGDMGLFYLKDEVIPRRSIGNTSRYASPFASNGTYCHSPSVARHELMAIVQNYRNTPIPEKRSYMYGVISTNCWYASQIAELVGAVSGDGSKLDLAKYAYIHTFDTEEYYRVVDKLPAYDREEFMRFVKTGPSQMPSGAMNDINSTQDFPSNYNPSGILPDKELSNGIAAIKGETFSSKKMKAFNELVNGRQTTTNQVREIIQAFSLEEDKLTVAKKCYATTTDQSNYYKLYELFTLSSSVDELKAFISAQDYRR